MAVAASLIAGRHGAAILSLPLPQFSRRPMNVRAMIRQYAQSHPNPAAPIYGGTLQKHSTRLAFDDRAIWRVDFEAALRVLDLRSRTVLMLLHGAGYTYDHIRAITGLNRRTIAADAHDGLLLLEDALKGQIPIPPHPTSRPHMCREPIRTLHAVPRREPRGRL